MKNDDKKRKNKKTKKKRWRIFFNLPIIYSIVCGLKNLWETSHTLLLLLRGYAKGFELINHSRVTYRITFLRCWVEKNNKTPFFYQSNSHVIVVEENLQCNRAFIYSRSRCLWGNGNLATLPPPQIERTIMVFIVISILNVDSCK